MTDLPQTQDGLWMFRGDIRPFKITFYEDQAKTTRLDLTNYTIRVTAKRNLADPDSSATFKKVSTNSGEITKLTQSGDTKGQCLVHPLHDDTKDLPGKKVDLWIDAQVTLVGSDQPETPVYTILSVYADVSQTVP